MNSMELFFSIATVVLTFTVFILIFLSVKKLYDYTGMVPDMWQRMLVGTLFITFSEVFGVYKILYRHSAYYLDFNTQLFELAGATLLLLGLVPYLDEVTGE